MRKLIELHQPSDYRFEGRILYLNPLSIMKVTDAERSGESLVYLTDGTNYTIDKPARDIANLIEEALK